MPAGCQALQWSCLSQRLQLPPKHQAAHEAGSCAATRSRDKVVEKQQHHKRLTKVLQEDSFTFHVLPVLEGKV